MSDVPLPRVLVIDDLCGRTVPESGNDERLSLCRSFRLKDVTGDQPEGMAEAKFRDGPLAEAKFLRGQKPVAARRGDTVENDLPAILAAARQGWHSKGVRPPWALVLLDLCFYTGAVTERSETGRCGRGLPLGRPADEERLFGLDVLSALRDQFPELPVVILSSVPRDTTTSERNSLGAVGFLDRASQTPAEDLAGLLFQHGLIPDSQGLIIGCSDALLLSLRAARRAASRDRPVLIRGERGTGKELLARYIHHHRGGQRPFVVVNCGQFQDAGLAHSALFGHKKGAYTGANRDRSGAVREAREGTLFLDEIGYLALEVQGGLHRLLQEGEIAPLGDEENPIRDVRVKLLTASNADLQGLTLKEPKEFLPDLLDRLTQGGTIVVPPLRERFDDLPFLVERFVRKAEQQSGPGTWVGRAIDPSVYDLLRRHDWPGNVRELEGCITRAVSDFKQNEMLARHFIDVQPSGGGDGISSVAHPIIADVPKPAPDLLTALQQVQFPVRAEQLEGGLRDVLRLLGTYLEAVLRSTEQFSPRQKIRKISLHPAAKLMTGDEKLTASQAADLFKRLLRPLEREKGLLTEYLAQALRRALEIRPSKPGRGDA